MSVLLLLPLALLGYQAYQAWLASEKGKNLTWPRINFGGDNGGNSEWGTIVPLAGKAVAGGLVLAAAIALI